MFKNTRRHCPVAFDLSDRHNARVVNSWSSHRLMSPLSKLYDLCHCGGFLSFGPGMLNARLQQLFTDLQRK